MIVTLSSHFEPYSFIVRILKLSEIANGALWEINFLSGMDAVKKIVETEAQARRVVEEAKTRAQQIISGAREDADKIRRGAIAQAQAQREVIVKAASESAEAEARQSDLETERRLESYRRLSDERKSSAVDKAVELILNA